MSIRDTWLVREGDVVAEGDRVVVDINLDDLANTVDGASRNEARHVRVTDVLDTGAVVRVAPIRSLRSRIREDNTRPWMATREVMTDQRLPTLEEIGGHDASVLPDVTDEDRSIFRDVLHRIGSHTNPSVSVRGNPGLPIINDTDWEFRTPPLVPNHHAVGGPVAHSSGRSEGRPLEDLVLPILEADQLLRPDASAEIRSISTMRVGDLVHDITIRYPCMRDEVLEIALNFRNAGWTTLNELQQLLMVYGEVRAQGFNHAGAYSSITQLLTTFQPSGIRGARAGESLRRVIENLDDLADRQERKNRRKLVQPPDVRMIRAD